MTMMNGLDVCDVELMDEEFFGPPPRFLRERSQAPEACLSREAHNWFSGMMAFFASITKLIRT
ncbi:MAG: hypothetical protein P8Y67_00075 [Alphaproteobacteria bacterium]